MIGCWGGRSRTGGGQKSGVPGHFRERETRYPSLGRSNSMEKNGGACVRFYSGCCAQIPRTPKEDHQSPESKPNSKGVRTRTSAQSLPVTLRGPELGITTPFIHYFWGGRDLAYIIVSCNKLPHTAGKSKKNSIKWRATEREKPGNRLLVRSKGCRSSNC